MTEERFYSVEEVAGRLQVDKQTVRRWIKSGRLSAYKPGLEWRIRPADLDEFLESRSYPKVQRRLPFDAPDEEALAEERRITYLRALRQFISQLGERWRRKIETGEADWGADPAESALDLLGVLLGEGVLGEVSKRRDLLPPDEFSELLQIGAAVQNLSEIAESIPATEEQAQELRRSFMLIQEGAA